MEERLIHPISNTEVQPRGPPPYSITAELYPNLFDRKGSEEEGTRILRDQTPAHYTLKINSFSQLAKLLSDTGVEKYESGEFEVSGYKWKLLLYPNGDKNRGGSGHISLYLVLSETNVLRLGLEVHASYRFFVYDQIRDEYLVIQDADMKERRFHTFKIERGFTKLLALSTLNDAANGYLVDDCCIFGAEVFVTNCTGKGESFFIIKQPTSNFSWPIDRFSSMDDYSTSSEEFIIRGHKWHLIVYPKGDAEGRDRSLSLFLELEDSNICHGKKIYVEYKFRVMDQVGNNHIERIGRDWFSSSSKIYGWPDFMPISDLTNKTKGYIVNDTAIVEADINLVCAAVKNLS